jgi:hypothetical protein
MADVTLTWNPPATGTGGPVTNYEVFRKQGTAIAPADIISSPDAGFPVTVAPVSGNQQTHIDNSLSSGAGDYCWTVRAVNAGGESAGALCTPPTRTL